VSHDGGVSFSRPIDIARVHDIQDPIPGANFRDNSLPSLAVDQSTGAVYVAWADLRSGAGRIVVSRSSDQGRAWSTPAVVSPAADGYAFFQGLDVAPSGRVDVGYQALKAKATGPTAYGTGNATIDGFYIESTDHGTTTWSASTKVTSVSSDPAAPGAEQPGTPVLGRLQHARLDEHERVPHLHGQSERRRVRSRRRFPARRRRQRACNFAAGAGERLPGAIRQFRRLRHQDHAVGWRREGRRAGRPSLASC